MRSHLGLARALSRRFANRGEHQDDLFQVACLGLVSAASRYDPDRGIAFSSFASATILGELKRHFRDKGWSVRLPRRVQELHLATTAASADLAQELGRAPTVVEVAERLECGPELIIEAMEAGAAYRAVSLDDAAAEGDAVRARLATSDEGLDRADAHGEARRMLAMLPPDDRRIVYLRFFEGMSQEAIARTVGKSQMTVSRALSRSLARIRAAQGGSLPVALA